MIDGGVVDVPGPVNFNFNFGFPPGKAYACMAENDCAGFRRRFEDYTIGKNISLQQVQEIDTIASKHGFRLSGFRSFEKTITAEQIEQTWLRAQAAAQTVLNIGRIPMGNARILIVEDDFDISNMLKSISAHRDMRLKSPAWFQRTGANPPKFTPPDRVGYYAAGHRRL